MQYAQLSSLVGRTCLGSTPADGLSPGSTAVHASNLCRHRSHRISGDLPVACIRGGTSHCLGPSGLIYSSCDKQQMRRDRGKVSAMTEICRRDTYPR